MALKKETIEALATALKMPVADLTTQLTDTAEHELPIGEFEVMKKTDFETLKTNLGTERFNIGRKEGAEETRKNIRNKFGIDGTKVKKTIPDDEFASAIETHIIEKHKITPDAKVSELESDKITLQGKVKGLTEELATAKSSYEKKDKWNQVKNTILGKAPETIIAKEDAFELGLKKTGITAELTDTGIVFKKGNEVMKNAVLSPLTVDEVVPMIFKEYIKPVTGGDGERDKTGTGTAGSFEAFIKEMTSAGISQNSQKFNEEMNKRISAKTLTV